MHQLKRCELLLRQLLQQLGNSIEIKSKIAYVNNEFFLYQAPFDESFVFPTQLMRLVKKLNRNKGKITDTHKNIAHQLAVRHMSRSAHERLPEYSYEALRKGIVCNDCKRYLVVFNQTSLVCKSCGNKEHVDTVVTRSVVEFQTLFPDRKITT